MAVVDPGGLARAVGPSPQGDGSTGSVRSRAPSGRVGRQARSHGGQLWAYDPSSAERNSSNLATVRVVMLPHRARPVAVARGGPAAAGAGYMVLAMTTVRIVKAFQ